MHNIILLIRKHENGIKIKKIICKSSKYIKIFLYRY